jgi:hypothetical protein
MKILICEVNFILRGGVCSVGGSLHFGAADRTVRLSCRPAQAQLIAPPFRKQLKQSGPPPQQHPHNPIPWPMPLSTRSHRIETAMGLQDLLPPSCWPRWLCTSHLPCHTHLQTRQHGCLHLWVFFCIGPALFLSLRRAPCARHLSPPPIMSHRPSPSSTSAREGRDGVGVCLPSLASTRPQGLKAECTIRLVHSLTHHPPRSLINSPGSTSATTMKTQMRQELPATVDRTCDRNETGPATRDRRWTEAA